MVRIKSKDEIVRELDEEEAAREETNRVANMRAEAYYKECRMNEARNFVYTQFEKLVRKALEKKESRVLIPSGHRFGGELGLDFFKPNEEHTEFVLKVLCDAGYACKVVESEEGNVEYVSRGEDYEIVRVPGTHTIYQLEVTL